MSGSFALTRGLLVATATLFALPAMAQGTDPVRDQIARAAFGSALPDIEARIQMNELDALAWMQLCRVQRGRGHLDEAQLACQRALELDPSQAVSAQALLAELALLAGDIGAASDHASNALDSLADAQAPTDASTAIDAAAAAVVLGRNDTARLHEAVRLLRSGVDAFPEDVMLRVALAELLLSKYNNAEAREWIESAAGLAPEHPRVMLGMANSLMFDNAPATADAVKALLERHPDYVPGLVLGARIQIEAEEYRAARETLARALVRSPRNAEALSLLAGIEYLLGNRDAAVRVVEDVLSRAPGYGQIYATLAGLAERNRRYRDAVEFALISLSVDRENWDAHATLGINRMRLGLIEQGRHSLEVAFANDPFNVRVKNTLDLLDRIETDYEKRASEHFVVLAHKHEIGAIAPLALPLAERAFAFYKQRYKHEPPTPMFIEFYPRHEDFSVRTAGVVGLGILGVSFGQVIAMDSPSAGEFGPLNWGSVLWHEIAHSFHLSMTRHRMPRWFSEGLAVYEERRARTGWGADLSPGFARAHMQGKLPPASRMNETFLRPESQSALVHGYFQASMFIEFVVSRAGFEGVLKMLEGFTRSRPFNAVALDVLALPRERMDAEFETFLAERTAVATAALSPPGGEGSDDEASAYEMALEKASELVEAGKQDAARAALLDAIRMAPDFADEGSAYWRLALLETEAGEHAEASATLEAMLAVNADSLEAYRLLAKSYREQGRLERERDALERALFVQPLDPRIHARLARTYEETQAWPRAADAYRALLSLAPTDAADANYRCARALHRSGASREARGAILRALERAPMYDEALDLLLEIREAKDAQNQ